MGLKGGAAALRALARAIAASPSWESCPSAALALRSQPRPRLALVGSFGQDDLALLEQQAMALRHGCGTLRYVSYRQAEEDCGRLADLLLDHFSGDISTLRFTTIPRGGHLVLGMLAKLLDLDHGQLDPAGQEQGEGDGPLVVVDDCSLSGERFAQWLASHQERRVVFAHLYSEPTLRHKLEEDDRVEACLASQDLRVHEAPSPEEAARRRELWRQRLGGVRHRTVRLDHLCFPWTEPHRTLWDAAGKRAVAAWNIVPEGFRLTPRRPRSGSLPVFEVPPAAGPLRPADDVLFAPMAGGLSLADFGSGESYFLGGSAPEMWDAVVASGNVEGALETLRETFVGSPEDPAPKDLTRDLDSFVRDLLGHGLLVRDRHIQDRDSGTP